MLSLQKYVDAISELKMHVDGSTMGVSHEGGRDGRAECILLSTPLLPITDSYIQEYSRLSKFPTPCPMNPGDCV